MIIVIFYKNNRAVDYVMQNNRAVEKTTETSQEKEEEKEEYKKEYDKEEEENAHFCAFFPLPFPFTLSFIFFFYFPSLYIGSRRIRSYTVVSFSLQRFKKNSLKIDQRSDHPCNAEIYDYNYRQL